MSVVTDHIYFRPIISAACFKISFSISNFSIFLRSSINSVSSSVRLSSSLKEPELSYCLTQRSNVDGFKSYSLIISLRGLLFLYSNTNCFLNSLHDYKYFNKCNGPYRNCPTKCNLSRFHAKILETKLDFYTNSDASIVSWTLLV